MERLTADAIERGNRFRAAATRELAAVTLIVRGLMRLWAEAELTRDAAIRAGADEECLPAVESFRSVPGREREVLETRRVKRWLNPYTGVPLNDEQTARVHEQGDLATLPGGSHQLMHLRHKQEFDRVVYREAELGPRSVSLAEALAVPGLMAGDTPGWAAPKVISPRSVLDQLDRLEQAPAPDRTDRRERKIDLRPVPGTMTPDAARPPRARSEIEAR